MDFNYKTWGNMLLISDSDKYKIKTLTIYPNSLIDLCSHNYINKHIIVLLGEAVIEINNNIHKLNINDYIYIPNKTKYQISNDTNYVIELLVTETGEYINDSDYIKYNKINNDYFK